MLSDYTPGAPFIAEVGAKSPAFVEFPTKESELFTFLEGSYYGNQFHKLNPYFKLVSLGNGEGFVFRLRRGDKKHTGLGSPQAFPFEDAWCCHDPNFDPTVFNNGRCAVQPVLDEGGNLTQQNICTCNPLGVCNTTTKNSAKNRCMVYDQNPMVGDIDHDECRDGNTVSRVLPMTVFLNSPCDQVGDPRDGKDGAKPGEPPKPGEVSCGQR